MDNLKLHFVELIHLFIYYYWAGSSADVPRKKELQDSQVLASYNDYSNVSELSVNKFKSSCLIIAVGRLFHSFIVFE